MTSVRSTQALALDTQTLRGVALRALRCASIRGHRWPRPKLLFWMRGIEWLLRCTQWLELSHSTLDEGRAKSCLEQALRDFTSAQAHSGDH